MPPLATPTIAFRSALKITGMARVFLIALCLWCAGCADLPHFGVEVGSQKVQNCVPGSARSCE